MDREIEMHAYRDGYRQLRGGIRRDRDGQMDAHTDGYRWIYGETLRDRDRRIHANRYRLSYMGRHRRTEIDRRIHTERDIDRDILRDTGTQTRMIPGKSFSTALTEFEAIAECLDTEI